jgi:hypothetical protein
MYLRRLLPEEEFEEKSMPVLEGALQAGSVAAERSCLRQCN